MCEIDIVCRRSRRGLNAAVGASGGLSSLMGSSANERQATLAAFGMDEDEIEQRISAMSINGAVPRGQEPPSPAVAYHPLAVVNAHHQPPLHNAAAVARGSLLLLQSSLFSLNELSEWDGYIIAF